MGGLAGYPLAPTALGQGERVIVTEPPPETSPPVEPVPVEPSPPGPPREQAPSEQDKPKEPIGHLRVGGGIGFGFGTGFVSVGVAPQVSYIMKRIVEPGVAFRYEFSRDRIVIPEVTWNTFGGSLFVRLYPIQPLFLLVEGEVINTGAKQAGVTYNRETYGNLLLGGGVLFGVGRGAFMGMSLKIAVLRNPFYPDAFPIISAGAGYTF